MPKPYRDRSMATPDAPEGPVEGTENDYFFPKHLPPTTIRAKSREEAEVKLAVLNTKACD